MSTERAGQVTAEATDGPAPPTVPAPAPTPEAAGGGAGAGVPLVAELVTDERAFAALGTAWERLHRRCSAATPFQSHAWLHSWWLSYGTPNGLRLFVVREGGELRAVAPLMRVRRPLPVLVPLGGAISDYADVLLDDEHAERAARALGEALAVAARTALIDFREVRPGGAVERIHQQWAGPRGSVRDSVCMELPALPMEELLGRLPASRAQRARAKLRKLAALGIEHRVVAPDGVEAALHRLLELHRLQWQGRKVTSEHLRPRFVAHLVRSVSRMARCGEALVTEFVLDGAVVAVDLTLLSRRLSGGYLYGSDPLLRERKADVATMLLQASAQEAVDGERRVLSLLRGAESYKYRWRPETVVNRRLLMARRRTAPLLLVVLARVAVRSRCRDLVHRWRERGGEGS